MYSEGLAQGTLSGAIPKDQEMYFQAILNNKGNFGMDDNNVLVFQGETADGTPFSIPANKLNQMPQPIGKMEDFQALVLPTVEALMKPEERNVGGRVVNASVIGPSAENPSGSQEWQNGVAASFDTFLDTYKDNGLKSLAVDHAGYTIEEMNDALNSGSYEGNDGEQYSSRLEYEMEKKFTEIASENYVYKEFENFNQLTADARRKTQQIQQMNAETSRINATNAGNQGRTGPERKSIAAIKAVKNKPAPRTTGNLEKDIQSINEGFLLDVPGMRVQEEDGKIFLVAPNGDGTPISESVWKDPNLLASWLAANAMKLPAGSISFDFEKAPIGGGVSPMQKISNFFTRKK